jgi:LysR family transcriptional regulator, regulator for bpeEF and oprC
MSIENPFLDLPVFIRVVELKSFTRAAHALSMSQSAVSQAVSRLEKRLGATLLRRTTRSLSLTAAGERYYGKSRNLLLELLDAQSELNEEQTVPRGRIRLSIPGTYGRGVLAAILGRFIRQYPQVELEVHLNDRQVDLIEEGYDLAVRIAPLGDTTLVARRIGSVQIGYFASPAWLRQHGAPRTPDELRADQFLSFMFPDGRPLPMRFRSPDGKNMQRMLRAPWHFSDGQALREAAAQGAGIAAMHTFVAERALQQKRLAPVLREWWPEPSPVWCVRPPGRLVPRRTRLLIAELERECG